MQDLTGKYPASLAPTSQEGGGLVDQGMPEAAMTAPGSPPVTPMPDPDDGPNLPLPEVTGTAFPLSRAPGSPDPLPAPDGSGRWSGTPAAAADLWKETP